MDKTRIVTIEYLIENIKTYHDGNRAEFAKAVNRGQSSIDKFLCGQRELKPYHQDHFYKHFKLLELEQKQ